MKHTPGPWRLGKSNLGNSIEGYCGRTFFDGDDGFRVVCMYQSCEPTGLYKEENENAKANARLIAAAPELLEALKIALDSMREIWLLMDNVRGPIYKGFGNLDGAIADKDETTEEIRIVMAAIDKATRADNGN